jgi:hypothetical protein
MHRQSRGARLIVVKAARLHTAPIASLVQASAITYHTIIYIQYKQTKKQMMTMSRPRVRLDIYPREDTKLLILYSPMVRNDSVQTQNVDTTSSTSTATPTTRHNLQRNLIQIFDDGIVLKRSRHEGCGCGINELGAAHGAAVHAAMLMLLKKKTPRNLRQLVAIQLLCLVGGGYQIVQSKIEQNDIPPYACLSLRHQKIVQTGIAVRRISRTAVRHIKGGMLQETRVVL